jgi:hypothetical protein
MKSYAGLLLASFFGPMLFSLPCFSNMYEVTAQAIVRQLDLDKQLNDFVLRNIKRQEYVAILSGSIRTAYEKKLTVETSYATLKERLEFGNDWIYISLGWSFK